MTTNHFKGQDKYDILSALESTGEADSKIFKVQESAIFIRCTDDIEKSVKDLTKTIQVNSSSNDRLSNKLFWLNVVLTAATVIGTVFGILTFIKK